jgi:squalene-associated FAD-dependent desaturase
VTSHLQADCVVIGGGLAGLSAAVRLIDAGRRVVVIESAARLGGRAATFADPVTGERVDNGQHVLFGCYRETYAFLRRIGTESLAPLASSLRLRMCDTDGRQSVLRCPRMPAPLHLLAGVMTWKAIPLRDRLGVLRVAPAILRRRPGTRADRELQSLTVSAWLRDRGQSPELRRWLWDPLVWAALNQSPDEASAAPFVRVLGELFGPRVEDSSVGLPAVPLDELFAAPAVRAIEAKGGTVITSAAGRIETDAAGRMASVSAGRTTIAADVVISAVPWHAFCELWPTGCPPALKNVCDSAAHMRSSPIVTVNLWLDRPVMTEPFVGLVGGSMHWAFDKQKIFGGTARHISLVSSGAAHLAPLDNAALAEVALSELRAALPAARSAQVVLSRVVRERRATFSLSPGEPRRPATATAVPGFFLAGDWTDTGLPATIEGAILSGHAAVDAVLRAPRR